MTLPFRDPKKPAKPSPSSLSVEQLAEGAAFRDLDMTDVPRWRWQALHRVMGPMMPGDLIVVGAMTGNVKTSFLLSQLARWASGYNVLYVPLELDPWECRQQ